MISVTVGARSRSCSGPKPKIVSLRSFFSVRRIRYFRSSRCRCGRIEVEVVGETALHAMDLVAHVAALAQVQPLADELQQPVQLRFALGNQGGGHVELVGSERGQVEILLHAGLQDELVDQVIAERQAGDLVQQRLVLRAEQPHLPADVLDVVFQDHDALRIVGPVGLELVQVEPFQQLAVDPQLEVGHDRAEMGFQLGAADGWRLFRPRR